MRHSFLHRLLAVCVLLLIGLTTVSAQHRKRPPFDPMKFEADLEQYITTHAGLTPVEAAKFFPVYKEMMKKMRSNFEEMRRFHHVNPKDERACAESIRKQDQLDIDMKVLQQEYHARFMLMLPASKVLAIIKAEEQFHRQAFKRMHK